MELEERGRDEKKIAEREMVKERKYVVDRNNKF